MNTDGPCFHENPYVISAIQVLLRVPPQNSFHTIEVISSATTYARQSPQNKLFWAERTRLSPVEYPETGDWPPTGWVRLGVKIGQK